MGACVGTHNKNTHEMEKANPENDKHVFNSPTKKINLMKPEEPFIMRLSEDKQNHSA
jgi:hypothetical protein